MRKTMKKRKKGGKGTAGGGVGGDALVAGDVPEVPVEEVGGGFDLVAAVRGEGEVEGGEAVGGGGLEVEDAGGGEGVGAGEEFGLVGVLFVIALFVWLTRRMMHIGRQAIALDRVFAGLVAQGVGIWMGFQAFINMGVNLGALPTKGLTLPLMSYGGSAILVNLVALAVVLRIDYENRTLMHGGRV